MNSTVVIFVSLALKDAKGRARLLWLNAFRYKIFIRAYVALRLPCGTGRERDGYHNPEALAQLQLLPRHSRFSVIENSLLLHSELISGTVHAFNSYERLSRSADGTRLRRASG